MKLSDMIISALVKRGVLYEARNVDVDFEIPQTRADLVKMGMAPLSVFNMPDKNGNVFTPDSVVTNLESEKFKIHFKCEHMSIKVDKE